jgi:hypothetical protein
MTSYWSDTSTTYTITGGTGSSVVVTAPAYAIDTPNTVAKVQFEREGPCIHPRLYFSYVKSKLSKMQKEALKARLSKLQKIVLTAEDTGQSALYEETAKLLAIVIRESEAVAAGFDTFIEKAAVDKFKEKVKDKVVKFTTLEKFPRTIPLHIRKKIKQVKSLELFDELHVLFLDYAGSTELKTNKEKIKEKDPILFGAYSFAPDRLYYIADWVDEYCDLTLEKFVEKLKQDDPEYGFGKVPEINDKFLAKIKNEVAARTQRLRDTRPNNFRDQMRAEDAEKNPPKKRPWWKLKGKS